MAGVAKNGTDGTDWLFGTDDSDDLHGYGGNDLLVGLGSSDALYGNAGNDLLFGGAGDDFIVGGEDNDHLDGGEGADWLLGESGNDTLIGGSGADWLDGGSGNDTVSYRDSPAGVHVSMRNDFQPWGGDAEGDTLFGNSIENLWGSKFNDVLWGGDADNVLNGFEGNDVLRGFYGNDSIDGGDGNDWLYGGYGNDWLNGGSSADRLEGGIGGDTMYGGSGADTFAWWYTTESDGTSAWNTDCITDFNRAEGDLMDLHGIDANDYWVPAPGNQDFTFIGDASHPFTAPGQISWYIGGSPVGEPSGTDTYILLNTDSEADAEGVIKVSGMHAVDASWFVL
jgi:Ca2+-binding RTX toxin-like protein